ncbi:MAG: hypothetical protein LBV41_10945 [Cytophagaceae bacterium]|nr:hypothetical protein [Cytophagaceae bacterium]
MMLFAEMASASVMQVKNIQYYTDVGLAPAIMDVQASVYNMAFEPVTMSFNLYSMEYGAMEDIPVCVAEFSDVGLKSYDTLIPSECITTLNYFAGNYNIKYRYGGLRCEYIV